MYFLQFATLDVFTQKAYEGNPLAIVKIPAYLRDKISQEKKQTIAREFNLSETVFIHEKTGEAAEWTIDIFTTNDELPFAGHPTIGTACFALDLQSAARGVATGTFITKAGRIPISLSSEGRGRAQADIPHNVHIHAHTIGDLVDPTPGLSSNRSLAQAEMRAPIVSIVKGMTFLLVQLDSLSMLAEVQSTNRDLSFHGILDEGWQAGFVAKYYYVLDDVVVNGNSARHGSEHGQDVLRLRTRMLEIAMEDPATGSAACALGSYLALKQRRTGKYEITQGVEMGRRSVIGVEVVIDDTGRTIESVRLSGSAVQVMEGTLRI